MIVEASSLAHHLDQLGCANLLVAQTLAIVTVIDTVFAVSVDHCDLIFLIDAKHQVVTDVGPVLALGLQYVAPGAVVARLVGAVE